MFVYSVVVNDSGHAKGEGRLAGGLERVCARVRVV